MDRLIDKTYCCAWTFSVIRLVLFAYSRKATRKSPFPTRKSNSSVNLILRQCDSIVNNRLESKDQVQLEKKFHFQELEWIVTFPNSGNNGKKYANYSVFFSDPKKASSNKKVCLVDIVENLEFQERFPHTVGFFKSKTDEHLNAGSSYLEVRLIRSVEEFWKFLNDLDL